MRTKHKAGYRHYKGHHHAPKKKGMNPESKRLVAERIADATGWNASWVEKLNDEAVLGMAAKWL